MNFTFLAALLPALFAGHSCSSHHFHSHPRCRADIAPVAVSQLSIDFIESINSQNLIAMNSLGTKDGKFESLAKNPITQQCFTGAGTFFDLTASTTVYGQTWTTFAVDSVNFLYNGNAVSVIKGVNNLGSNMIMTITWVDKHGNCDYKIKNVLVQDQDCLLTA